MYQINLKADKNYELGEKQNCMWALEKHPEAGGKDLTQWKKRKGLGEVCTDTTFPLRTVPSLYEVGGRRGELEY